MQIFEFLSLFPSRGTFADAVMTGKAEPEDLFPPGKFFQAKYAAQALRSRLREQIRSVRRDSELPVVVVLTSIQSSVDETFLANAIRHLDAALLNPRLLSDPISSFEELRLAAVLVSVLLEFVRGISYAKYSGVALANLLPEAERPSPDTSATYFSNGPVLADRLLNILSVALDTKEDAAVAQDAFAVMVEASLHSRAIWEAFINNANVSELHQALLLSDPRQSVREHVSRKIASVCGGDLPSTCPLTKGEIASRFWAIISAILPEAVCYPEQSQQLFEIAEHVFRANDEYNRDENSLRAFLMQWSDLLLKHNHKEIPGREETDYVVLGFTKLLSCCIISIKSFKKALKTGTLMEQIFKKYMFSQRYVV